MTTWRVVNTDIFDVKADGLICSANPSLNLSGGVGGAFLLRYGNEMQDYLHRHLRDRNTHHVERGGVIIAPPCNSPFIAVAHAVAIDAFYETSIGVICQTYERALNQLATKNCRTVVASCLGCGYGRCPINEFIIALKSVAAIPFPTLDVVTFATTDSYLAEAIASRLASISAD